MCSVSVMQEYMRTNVPLQQWTPDTFGEYKEILRRLNDLDAKLNQPDCEDPAKAAWMREVEERLDSLEREQRLAAMGG